ncbi:MAG: LPS-assembly protein LptD [Alphaproteobacteria bacterium]|nr:LPS-assembly protein LptD [Alphaproteobacteria bacterium]
MYKKLLLFTLFVLVFTSITLSFAISNDSLVLLNTSKTIEETKPKSLTKIEPTYNITNVLDIPKKDTKDEIDIYFSADELSNDANSDTVTATGNVEIIREDLTLRADKVIYNQATDDIKAEGNIVLLEKSGNVVFADKINLKEHMQKADVDNIKVILADKTRLAASSFHKKNDDTKVLRKAVYTPCDNCQGQSPLWQLKAYKVIHDTENQDIEYQNAFLEIKGVPVLYTPYFSHPDPSVKHRSGFLFPRIMSNNYLGAAIQPQYFWDISPQENVTFNPIISSDKGIIYSAIYNKYFYRGELSASGSFMQDKDADNSEEERDKNRGNLFLYGRYELNDYWVADTDINYASDDNYLKDLALPRKDDSWLTSRVRLQAFDNRNYASVEGYYYDFLSYNLRNKNTPYVLPLMTYENISSSNRYGAYTKTTLNTASIYHEEDDASHRASMINSWNLPYTSPYGEKYRLVASVKSDLYYISQYRNDNNENYTGTTGRIFPQLGLEWRLPFIKNTENTSQIIEPIIVAAVAPNQDNKIDKIPNEDSEDTTVTDVNIFDLDRYSGYDRNDVGSRISYGLNWSFYDKDWGRSAALIAQSYEFDKEENLFNQPDEQNHFSDYVGRIYAQPNEHFSLNYRFRLDKNSYSINYSELSTYMGNDTLWMSTSYIFFPETTENAAYEDYRRKEIYTSVGSKITRNWAVKFYTRHDLENKEAISHGGGIIYEDECSRFSFNAEKEYSDDPEDETDDLSFYFTFYLKTIGGIGND